MKEPEILYAKQSLLRQLKNGVISQERYDSCMSFIEKNEQKLNSKLRK